MRNMNNTYYGKTTMSKNKGKTQNIGVNYRNEIIDPDVFYRQHDENVSLKKQLQQLESENEEEENNKEKDITEEDEFQIAIKKYNTLRESISKRINELETFYEDNIEDIRVSNFEKARLRLKKLLMYSYENLTKIENSSQQHNVLIV